MTLCCSWCYQLGKLKITRITNRYRYTQLFYNLFSQNLEKIILRARAHVCVHCVWVCAPKCILVWSVNRWRFIPQGYDNKRYISIIKSVRNSNSVIPGTLIVEHHVHVLISTFWKLMRTTGMDYQFLQKIRDRFPVDRKLAMMF